MQIVFMLLVLFLVIGLFARRFDKWARLAMLAVIVLVITYISVAGG